MILWFSGTGNSLDVARRLASITGDTLERITHDLESIDLSRERRLIWVYPIYSWGVPPVVGRCIERVRFYGAESVVHHSVATCGDDCGRADKMWRKAVESRGLNSGGAFTVIMPNNYVSLPGFDVDSRALAESKLAASQKRIEQIAARLAEIEQTGAKVSDVTRGALPRLKTGVIYPWFVRYAINPAKFNVTEGCIGCGRCEQICPMRNISRPERRPAWGTDCAGCLACYHVCPVHAVDYGKATRSKGQYLNPSLKTAFQEEPAGEKEQQQRTGNLRCGCDPKGS